MKKKIIKKLRSKRGLTLLEILIGVTLVVIVFSSTLGAMVGGYTTTIYNADENRSAVINASLNEAIVNTVHNLAISNKDKLDMYVEDIGTAAVNANNNVIVSAVEAMVPEAKYVAPVKEGGEYVVHFLDTADAAGNDYSYQYSLIPEKNTSLDIVKAKSYVAGSGVNAVSIKGITVKTCFYSAQGPVIYESFVPYTK